MPCLGGIVDRPAISPCQFLLQGCMFLCRPEPISLQDPAIVTIVDFLGPGLSVCRLWSQGQTCSAMLSDINLLLGWHTQPASSCLSERSHNSLERARPGEGFLGLISPAVTCRIAGLCVRTRHDFGGRHHQTGSEPAGFNGVVVRLLKQQPIGFVASDQNICIMVNREPVDAVGSNDT